GFTDAPCQNQHGSLLALSAERLEAACRQWESLPSHSSPHHPLVIEVRPHHYVVGIGISLINENLPHTERQFFRYVLLGDRAASKTSFGPPRKRLAAGNAPT